MIKIYSWATRLATPFLRLYIAWRRHRRKEDLNRYQERFGYPSLPRHSGQLLWIHAASVGESLSILPLIDLLVEDADLQILMTTGTVTSAKLMDQKLPSRCFHQYVPLDNPRWIERFLAYWRPCVGIFVESDLWPNILKACKRQHIPLILLNARLSPRSERRWKNHPALAKDLFSCFDLILTQSKDIVSFLTDLGHPNTHFMPSIKLAAAPLAYDPQAYTALKIDTEMRPLWVAASTHAPEEALVADMHLSLKKNFPNLLTIIVPRHPNRGEGLQLALRHLQTVRRTQSPRIPQTCEIYIADTLGELGLFYALAPFAFVGGSFVPIGGHNPIEPALLDCASLWGPHVFNFEDICDMLAPGSWPVHTPEELHMAVESLLGRPEHAQELAATAKRIIVDQREILDTHLALLRTYLHAHSTEKPRLLA